MKDTQFQEQAEVFNNKDATKSDIIVAGEKSLLPLYNERSEQSLDSLRYLRFCQKITKGLHFYSPNVSLLLLQPLSTTASGFTTRYSSGEVLRSRHKTGLGNLWMQDSYPSEPTCQQLTNLAPFLWEDLEQDF